MYYGKCQSNQVLRVAKLKMKQKLKLLKAKVFFRLNAVDQNIAVEIQSEVVNLSNLIWSEKDLTLFSHCHNNNNKTKVGSVQLNKIFDLIYC